ncbi:hypothetical protein NX059_000991 [Plenodomus lindquistii]|nr:hypothetical protein NX059_000991 [Plenodomus lindquistii]
MSAVPDKVLNWLYSVLTSEYSHVQRTYKDAAEVLASYPSLTTRTDIYTYENGASALLLLLSGTLPVTFRGATYGFPVAMWVPYGYPREPPIVYITPSPDMVVRPGQHVGGDGRVYHPYLAQWAQYWDKSTLFDLVAVLRGVFAKEPPVRSKQQQQPHPPPPAEWQRSVHGQAGASPSSGPSSQPPAPPPKPPKPGDQNRPTRQPPRDGYSQPPPLPPHPPRHGHGAPGRQASLDISPATPASRQPWPYAAQHYEAGSPVSPMTPEGRRYHQAPHPQQYGQHHPPQQHPPQHAPPAPKPPVDLLDDSLQVTLPSQSNSHIPTPVPPVPPNPEKDALLRALSQTLVAQIRQTVSSNHSAIGPLQAQQHALQAAHARLQAELGELQQLDASLASNEQVLKGAMVEADRVMDDARRRPVPDVDDVLVAPTLVGGQLYTLAAEEKGIADAIFVLGRALDKGRVGTEVFVKQTRSLAREQFMRKALIKKIAQGMALNEYHVR